MWAGGRTDMTKLVVAFRNFVNAPKHTSEKEIDDENDKANWRHGKK